MSDNSKNELFHFWGVTPAGDITLNGFQRGVNNIVCHHDIPQYCNVNFVKCHNIVFKPEFNETKSTAKLVFKKCTFKEIIESSKDNVVICPK